MLRRDPGGPERGGAGHIFDRKAAKVDRALGFADSSLGRESGRARQALEEQKEPRNGENATRKPPRRPPRTPRAAPHDPPPRKPNGKAQRPGNPRTLNDPWEANQPPGRAAEAPKAPETRFRARGPNARNRRVNGRTQASPGPLCADATPGRPLSSAEPNAHIYTPPRAI